MKSNKYTQSTDIEQTILSVNFYVMNGPSIYCEDVQGDLYNVNLQHYNTIIYTHDRSSVSFHFDKRYISTHREKIIDEDKSVSQGYNDSEGEKR